MGKEESVAFTEEAQGHSLHHPQYVIRWERWHYQGCLRVQNMLWDKSRKG
jgi:hypothetical protein